jgi:hypothetical protein
VFWREGGEVIEVVTVQKSQWNDASSASFTLNLGLYWKRVQELLGRTISAPPPREYNCTIRERIGPLFSAGRDHWWEVTPETDVAAIGVDVVAKLVEHGLPWLERGHSLEQMIEFVERTNSIPQRKAILALRRDGKI